MEGVTNTGYSSTWGKSFYLLDLRTLVWYFKKGLCILIYCALDKLY